MTPARGGDRLDGEDFDDHDIPLVTYDHDDSTVVVIIGSGAGGGTIADELSRNGIDTIVGPGGSNLSSSTTFTGASVVPEASVALVGAFALGSLALLRLRRRR